MLEKYVLVFCSLFCLLALIIGYEFSILRPSSTLCFCCALSRGWIMGGMGRGVGLAALFMA